MQLPSSNPDSAAAQGLTEDVAVVRAAVEAVEGPVVPAAHSYGGVPATWAAAESDQVTEPLNWQGLRAFTEKLGAAPTDVPLTYVVATEDPARKRSHGPPPATDLDWSRRSAAGRRTPRSSESHRYSFVNGLRR
ncbi:hypothetical protein ABZ016_17755 [Streptomyces sp. NPDC006372]|uniref:hypothetical protein n=1 Tax=Streptomyces sp. NPDC006372 TaxID=3155599 RepID=UPI0033ACDA9F